MDIIIMIIIIYLLLLSIVIWIIIDTVSQVLAELIKDIGEPKKHDK